MHSDAGGRTCWVPSTGVISLVTAYSTTCFAYCRKLFRKNRRPEHRLASERASLSAPNIDGIPGGVRPGRWKSNRDGNYCTGSPGQDSFGEPLPYKRVRNASTREQIPRGVTHFQDSEDDLVWLGVFYMVVAQGENSGDGGRSSTS